VIEIILFTIYIVLKVLLMFNIKYIVKGMFTISIINQILSVISLVFISRYDAYVRNSVFSMKCSLLIMAILIYEYMLDKYCL